MILDTAVICLGYQGEHLDNCRGWRHIESVRSPGHHLVCTLSVRMDDIALEQVRTPMSSLCPTVGVVVHWDIDTLQVNLSIHTLSFQSEQVWVASMNIPALDTLGADALLVFWATASATNPTPEDTSWNSFPILNMPKTYKTARCNRKLEIKHSQS
jgi:hypothetical protein